ncbi:Ig-like domain-containing protein [Arachnia propionica]|uniref:Ig-like domain-containing protein n=2 Tax=Arachnia propionica TaxID=1750 RepID=UPI00398FBC7C
MKTISARRGRRSLAVFLAFLIGLAGIAIVSPAARADEVAAIDSTSVKLTKMDAEEAAIYMWSNVRVDANWSIPDGTGHAGDTFKIMLPKELGGAEGTFELKGREGDQLTYGSCKITKTEVVCTFNANVENKNNVGGSLWVKTQAVALTTASKLSFEVSNGTKVEVPLPDGQQGIGYKPYVPTEIDKAGWFPGADQSTIHWRIVIPGDKISDRSSVTITDDYLQAGSNLTVSAGHPKIFWIPSTPKCWNELESAECRNDLSDSSVPSSTVTVDDDKDQVKAVLDNKGQNFQADRIYVFDLELTTDGEIPVGSQYVNRGFVDGEMRTARTVKTSSGGGTGSGDTVGHIGVKKAVANGNVPGDTVFPVTWSYQYKGATRTGELALGADGTVETLNNVPNGVVVTLTERVPVVAGFDFGDPVFSGAGVADGVPDGNSAKVTVEGMKTVEVTLTNQVNPRLAPVEVTPGVCAPGASEPSEPTVEVGPTDGITYSVPEFSKAGDQVTVKVTATPAAGREIDDQNLPAGWVANGDGSFTFTTTVTQPVCEKVVTPVVPIVDPGVCPVDSTTPTKPSVSGVEDTEQIDYGEPVITGDGDRVTVSVTAAAKSGYRIDTANLPEGWSVVGGVVTYTITVTQPKCVVPVAPRIDVGTCPADSLTPTPPSAVFDPVEGLEFSEPRVEVRDGKVTVTATATAKQGFQIGGVLPEGWTRVNEIAAKFTATRDQPVCQAKKVVPVAPVVSASVCRVGSTAPSEPEVTLPTTEGIVYAVASREFVGGKFRYTVTAAPAGEVFVIDADRLGAGWGAPVNGVSTYTGEVDVPACVTPVAPKIDVGTCPVGATTPTPPSASFDPVEGLEFSEPKIEVRDGKVTVTATATAKPGFQIGGVLPEGWTRVDETTAEFSATRDQPVCDAPTPTPSVPPSVTPTPAPTTTVTPKPVKPGLPKTGA